MACASCTTPPAPAADTPTAQTLTAHVAACIKAAWDASAGPPPPAPSPELDAATMAYAFRHSAAVEPYELRRRLTALQRAAFSSAAGRGRAAKEGESREQGGDTKKAARPSASGASAASASAPAAAAAASSATAAASALGTGWAAAALRTMEEALSAYYAADWSQLLALFRANRPLYIAMAREIEGGRLRRRQQRPLPAFAVGGGSSADVETLADVKAALAQSCSGRILVLFGADFCRHCRALQPSYAQVRAAAGGRALHRCRRGGGGPAGRKEKGGVRISPHPFIVQTGVMLVSSPCVLFFPASALWAFDCAVLSDGCACGGERWWARRGRGADGG